MLERAAHVREVLTGYRSGNSELATEIEPRPEYSPDLPLYQRYEAKAAELGIVVRTVQRWVRDFQYDGEAGLVPRKDLVPSGPIGQADRRWVETALKVMVEHTSESKRARGALCVTERLGEVFRRERHHVVYDIKLRYMRSGPRIVGGGQPRPDRAMRERPTVSNPRRSKTPAASGPPGP